jgi:hypothetical protein
MLLVNEGQINSLLPAAIGFVASAFALSHLQAPLLESYSRTLAPIGSR